MSDLIIDSSVVAKWVLPEADSPKALRILTDAAANNDRLVVLDLVFSEVANAIWKRRRQGMLTATEAAASLQALTQAPVRVEPAVPLLAAGFDIAVRYDRAVYDALFLALSQQLGAKAVTADEPLFNSTRQDFPQLVLLRNM
jgi:predicted nucleic acid-binding protein